MEREILLERGGLQTNVKISAPAHSVPERIVLGIHGIGGSTEDEIQVGIAEEMAMFSAVSLRFDFPGHGKNPMADDAFSVRNCVSTLLEVAGWAREEYPTVEDLCIFATGFGAYITLLCLDALNAMPGKLKLVVQTPSVLMHETLLLMINKSKETFRLMDCFVFPVERPLVVDYGFYEELTQNIALNAYDIPMLILHGEEDTYIRHSDIRQFRRINEEAKLVFIPGTTHRFQEEGAWDMVLDLTRDWFAFEQVLVCDWE
jgi:alpha-beta hydrolase superfamily lysophospholipase